MKTWAIDWFSSPVMVPGWIEYGDEPFLWRGPPTYDPLLVFRPRPHVEHAAEIRSASARRSLAPASTRTPALVVAKAPGPAAAADRTGGWELAVPAPAPLVRETHHPTTPAAVAASSATQTRLLYTR